MLPVFHADNFKTWTPPFRTGSSSRHSRLQPPSNGSPAINPPQPPLPQTLPLPKHQLPASPPAEVCTCASAMTQSSTFRAPQCPFQKSLGCTLPQRPPHQQTRAHSTQNGWNSLLETELVHHQIRI
jgi:hypothetical protein